MKNTILIISLILNFLLCVIFIIIINHLGGFNYLMVKLRIPQTAKYIHKKKQFELLPPKNNSIILIGNSLIAQGNWDELVSTRCLNRGIGGDDSRGILNRIDEICRHNPSEIFIMCGINDIGKKRSIQSILMNYKEILSQISSQLPNTELYVQSILPVNNQIRKTGRTNSDILKLNMKLKELSKAFNCHYLDLYSAFIDESGNLDKKYSADGLHINGNGYLIWSSKIINVINNNNEL